MRHGLIVLGLILCFSGSLVLGSALSSEGAGEEKTISEDAWIISYRTSSGSHLLLSESSKTAYPVVEVYIYGNGAATVTVDGLSELHNISGLVCLMYNFEAGTSHDISIDIGSVSKDYSLKVAKTISIKEIDPDTDEVITIFETEFEREKLIAGLTAFFSACIGIYVAFRIARWRAANGVDTL